MNAIQRSQLLALYESPGSHVGRNHAFLDEAVGVVSNDGFDTFDLAVLCKKDPGFESVQVNGAAPLARPAQRPIKRVQRFEMRQ